LSKIMSYAQLQYACAVTDASVGQFFQTTSERVNAIATRLLFFTLEINRLPDQAIKQKLKSPALKRYASWLRDVRAWRAHELSDDMEKLLHEKSPSGRAAW
ncbi:MAG: M3 family oligoendopeptidase, partial [Alphaproteobacteria bacterium]